MAVDLKTLKTHPGANPDYERDMIARLKVQGENRARKEQARRAGLNPQSIPMLAVPKQPNKYVPHIGAKQRAKASK